MDKLRLGVIGVGSVVREIYQYLYYKSDFAHLLDVQAIADPNDEYRDWFGETWSIPKNRRFASHTEMLEAVELDAVQVNTPDHIHRGPTVDALAKGLDALIPKPCAATIADAHAMIEAARDSGRLLGIDFHKREDPRIKEAEARYQSGRYGRFQTAVWYMLDKLQVADPNHEPMFFATPDFAATNTPISFLTVHMADAFMKIVGLKPVEVRATGWSQKLPSLTPVPVDGYDLCDTEIRFENGGVAHVITGWHLPNSAHALTVQSSRMICTDGVLDLSIDRPGYHEIHPDGIFEVNPMFRNFDKTGMVTGYGMTSPGRMYQKFLADRRGELADELREEMMTPIELGFYTTLVLQAGEESLQAGERAAEGVTVGTAVDLRALLVRELGEDAARAYGY